MYYTPHNPSFFIIHVLPYNTTFALILTSVSDVSTSIYLVVEFTFYFSAKSICKVMGMRCIRNKRLGAALTWFLRSKVSYKPFDIASVDTLHVCWSVFDYGYFIFVGCGIRYSSCWKVLIPKSFISIFSISLKG